MYSQLIQLLDIAVKKILYRLKTKAVSMGE